MPLKHEDSSIATFGKITQIFLVLSWILSSHLVYGSFLHDRNFDYPQFDQSGQASQLHL